MTATVTHIYPVAYTYIYPVAYLHCCACDETSYFDSRTTNLVRMVCQHCSHAQCEDCAWGTKRMRCGADLGRVDVSLVHTP